jgi:heme/copper-type cytochrome/quinol oxidase subunit 2
MNRGQRFAFLAVALVIAVVAVVVLADSSEDDSSPSPAAATATATATPEPTEASPGEDETPTPTATATATPTPEPPPLLTADNVTELEAKQGETVRFRVRSDTPDHVHVHGYDLMKDVVPGETITMSFKATITGIFEIELEDAGTEIASLKVEPD